MSGDLLLFPRPSIHFLNLADVLELHARALLAHGGADGLRDEGLLRSALAQPEQTFEGQYLHRTLFDQAAAYTFHISQNQPFNDGNKRTGLACGIAFLWRNKILIHRGGDELTETILAIAAKTAVKATLADVFRKHATHRAPALREE